MTPVFLGARNMLAVRLGIGSTYESHPETTIVMAISQLLAAANQKTEKKTKTSLLLLKERAENVEFWKILGFTTGALYFWRI